MIRNNGVGRNSITRWGKVADQRPTFHYLAEDDEEAERDAGGTQSIWKNVFVVVDSGAAEILMPKSMFPEVSTWEAEDPRMGRGSKDQELWTAGHVRQNP